MKTFFKFAVARLGEASSWRGGIMVLTGLGVYVSPDAAEAITAFGLALAGLIGVLTADPVAPAGE